jgi:hippurate hydrolase
VRSYTPEVRKLLLDGIKRIARGEAIAAGLPDDRMPIVTIREAEYTPATFNTEKLSNRALELFTANFGSERVIKTPAVMGGEDFSRYWLADKSIESLIFWVGGTPPDKWKAAGGDSQKLPSLHSPFWAPQADTVIATATEALTLTALDILKKS